LGHSPCQALLKGSGKRDRKNEEKNFWKGCKGGLCRKAERKGRKRRQTLTKRFYLGGGKFKKREGGTRGDYKYKRRVRRKWEKNLLVGEEIQRNLGLTLQKIRASTIATGVCRCGKRKMRKRPYKLREPGKPILVWEKNSLEKKIPLPRRCKNEEANTHKQAHRSKAAGKNHGS